MVKYEINRLSSNVSYCINSLQVSRKNARFSSFSFLKELTTRFKTEVYISCINMEYA